MPAILDDFERLIVPNLTHWSHPGFLNFFPCSNSDPGIVAELLAAALNVNGLLWRSSPAVTELEQATLRWLAQWVGLDPLSFGILHDTASTATFHALVAARQQADPESRELGLRGNLTVYTSEYAHSSVLKGALAAGFGAANTRRIPTDSRFALIPDALHDAIQRDLEAGLRPAAIVATIGTTTTAAVDPVPAIAAIAHRHRIWLHVDAAYAGTLAILPEFRHLMDGTQLADSIVLNPHKWMMVPFDCSALYTRKPETFRDAFSLVPSYLATHESAVSFMDYGIPLGRRFRALKLWFVMRHFGRDGISRILRRHIEAAQWLAAQIESHPNLELAAPLSTALVCLRSTRGDDATAQLAHQINTTREFFVGTATAAGRLTLRVAIGTPETGQAEIARFWNLLARLA
jgi:aromatic-L-amino-acid decarboxylase